VEEICRAYFLKRATFNEGVYAGGCWRVALVGSAEPLTEAALFGDAERGAVIGMDEANGAGIAEAGIAPG
jgi:hypothetical protein